MTHEQNQVNEFMRLFGYEVKKTPELPSLDIRRLRANLILEEAAETIRALGFKIQTTPSSIEVVECCNPDLVLIADGLADLHYVAYCGTGAACGLDMEPIFAEVHRSNMTKLWSYKEIAMRARENPNEQWTFLETKLVGEKSIIVRNGANKTVKSPSYSPARIEAEIQRQQIAHLA
jgi:predicted HAD superfamily Cof-like phosphohydrolase